MAHQGAVVHVQRKKVGRHSSEALQKLLVGKSYKTLAAKEAGAASLMFQLELQSVSSLAMS